MEQCQVLCCVLCSLVLRSPAPDGTSLDNNDVRHNQTNKIYLSVSNAETEHNSLDLNERKETISTIMVDTEPKEVEKSEKSVEFGQSTEASIKSANSGGQKRRGSKRLSQKGSSFFNRVGASFRRSSGERGADVDTLRGINGPDFEGYALINRGDGAGCGCFDGKDLKERLLLIKGPFVFVFSSEEDKAPKYAISLAHLKTNMRGLSGGFHVVTLETNLGDLEYEISFKQENIAEFFVAAAKEQASAGEAEEVRKRLGHEHLLHKRASVKYAEGVAMKKMEDQPEKPERLTAEEMARGVDPIPGI